MVVIGHMSTGVGDNILLCCVAVGVLEATVGVLELGVDAPHRAAAAAAISVGTATAQAVAGPVEALAAAAVATEFIVGVGVFAELVAGGGVPRLEARRAARELEVVEFCTIGGDMLGVMEVGAPNVATVGF